MLRASVESDFPDESCLSYQPLQQIDLTVPFAREFGVQPEGCMDVAAAG
jgi:hypothetical protein